MKKHIFNKGDKVNGLIFLKDLPDHIQPNGKKKRKALFECKCGNHFESHLYRVVKQSDNSCHECVKKKIGKSNSTHGLSKHPVFWIWSDIKRRCYNTNSKSYKSYGAKGIEMYSKWIDNVKEFFDYVTSLPNYDENNLGMNGLTIDRIDCYKGYEPNNLRWENATMQNINKPLQKNNKTGYRGVSKSSYGRYQVQVRLNRKTNYIGKYKDLKEAVLARNKWLKQNGIFEEYTKYETAIKNVNKAVQKKSQIALF